MKTVKREANVGERIVVKNPMVSFGVYGVGDIFTVNFTSMTAVSVKEMEGSLWHAEYEVIIAEPNEYERSMTRLFTKYINDNRDAIRKLASGEIEFIEEDV